MRVVVTGATGNAGTSLLRALAADPRVDEIVGVARRRPSWDNPRTRWVQADVARDPLAPVFAGADTVVHLAWVIQPARDQRVLHAINVDGSRRVFDAAVQAGAGALVYASSIGAYSPGPKDRGVDESWPTDGIPTSFYSRHKSATERMLDEVESAAPGMRVVRLRPALKFKREAAAEIRRYFIGPLLPSPLVHPALVALVPSHPRLRVQAVHTDDVAQAYRLAALEPHARGAYNVAADPVIDPDSLSELLDAGKVRTPGAALRALAAASFKLRVQPTPPGWVDMGLGVPLMDTTRAREHLGWTPTRTATDALMELLEGLRKNAGGPTPPLDPKAGGPLRIREFTTGIGRRSGVRQG
jgi:UDP-glucose 4-epimerase